ncbi:hypothetical protein O181_048897 [Austropuccinia psidii MF-1]|uniref:DUF4211 domain-containing protein n=1 Tax=Austropuccinia psidii MF-1 TaxID=1389203 RepID=A0A9Q3DVX9_9BASI|nr:hypothetical protein [Austropuccinia psidii MF-1]
MNAINRSRGPTQPANILKSPSNPVKLSKSAAKCERRIKRQKAEKALENSEDENYLSLPDYSEPETKLRRRNSGIRIRRKFDVIRKARKEMNRKAIIRKEVNSKRILPDSEDESQKIESNKTSETDSYRSSETEGEKVSETDEEERKRKEEDFVIDDMPTPRQQRMKFKQMRKLMPEKFRAARKNILDHFKLACQYIIFQLIIPQIKWRNNNPKFDESCSSSTWIPRFRNAMLSRPFMVKSSDALTSWGCAACNYRTKASDMIVQFHGSPYDPFTLREIEPSQRSTSSKDEDNMDSYSDISIIDGRKTQAALEGHIHDLQHGLEFICYWKLYQVRALKKEVVKHWPVPLPDPTDPLEKSGKGLKEFKKEVRKIYEKVEWLVLEMLNKLLDKLEEVERKHFGFKSNHVLNDIL